MRSPDSTDRPPGSPDVSPPEEPAADAPLPEGPVPDAPLPEELVGDAPLPEELVGDAPQQLDGPLAEPSPFPHPPWTVNLVLVAGVITLLFGLLVSPIWLLVGSPFLLVLTLWLYVRLFARR